jgi:CRISPR-associated protein Cas1
MIKRTLYFGNPAYLKTSNEQLVVERKDEPNVSAPIEDIGLVILDHQQITISQALIAKLLANNVALVTCNETHHPTGMLLTLDGNSLQSQKYQAQVAASLPLKKQLWQQTIECKIHNQAAVLAEVKEEYRYLLKLAGTVRSGDMENNEAKAAGYYWKKLFPPFLNFSRHRDGPPPNNYLNYGYAILRAIVARSLVGSGLLPTLGIHHRNQYNAYCLADDIMEPYRPYVDRVVYQIVRTNGQFLEMTPNSKKALLNIPAIDVDMDGQQSPLMNSVTRTTASLVKCFEGTQRKILYPRIPID